MKPLRVAITTLGCKVNQADADALMRQLSELAVQVPFDGPADLYLINSCTVTATADRQSRQLVHRARRRSPAGRVVLTGCLAVVGEGTQLLPDEVDAVFPPARHPELVAYARQLATEPGRSEARPGPRTGRARPFLKLQDGCDHACTYCIVPRARGRSRSVLDPEQARAALGRLAAQGFGEVVLTGIHLGQYGQDLDPPLSLAGLLAALDGAGPPRIRLSSIEPRELEPALVEIVAGSPRFCPHLHVPIQSGDDGNLAAMNRPYRSAEIRDLLQQLRERMPDAALGTDLIAGFPGETEAQFEASLDLVQRAPLTHLHVFPYSPRPGTPAAALPQLPAAVRRQRAARLRQAGQDRLRAFAAAQLGQTREVLVEELPLQGGERLLSGVTDNYVRVLLPGDEAWVGQLVRVRLEALLPGGVALRGARVTGRG
jgi:threonylcarbamoyladenosine tRNA methylthiotransferase MtaB